MSAIIVAPLGAWTGHMTARTNLRKASNVFRCGKPAKIYRFSLGR